MGSNAYGFYIPVAINAVIHDFIIIIIIIIHYLYEHKFVSNVIMYN